jgi:hypothetical protein
MALTVRRLRPVVAGALAAVELIHPAWSEGSVSQAVAAAGSWWLPLHLLLIGGYAALVRLLWTRNVAPRVMLAAFLVCNTTFLAIDGIAVGVLATPDPRAADALWTSPLVTILANLTGATWAAAVLCFAGAHLRRTRSKPVEAGLVLTWLLFVAGTPPLSMPPLFSRLTAAATGALIVYAQGAAAVPAALLVFAAVLHQHVGGEAALGLLLIAIALTRLPEPG